VSIGEVSTELAPNSSFGVHAEWNLVMHGRLIFYDVDVTDSSDYKLRQLLLQTIPSHNNGVDDLVFKARAKSLRHERRK